MNTRFLLLPVIVWAAGSLAGAEFTAADLEFFEKKIRPCWLSIATNVTALMPRN